MTAASAPAPILLPRHGVLEGELCQAVVKELAGGQSYPSSVALGGCRRYDSSRQSKRALAPAWAEELVGSRFAALKAELADAFAAPLGIHEKPQFLIYGVGDRFEYHLDGSPDVPGPEYLRRRLVSVVLFLNGQNADGFSGGSLRLFGLKGERRSLAIAPETGLLIAFSSQTYHKVEPVTHGQRFTVVSWFPRAE